MITNTLELQLTPGGIPPLVHVNQYETGGRELVFRLYDGNTEYAVPTGATVTLYGRRPDGIRFTVPCSISDGTITATVSADMSRCFGKVNCEIEVVSASTRVSTENFILLVEKAAYGSSTPGVPDTDNPGQTVQADSLAAMAEALPSDETPPADTDLMITARSGSFVKRALQSLWGYIKQKTDHGQLGRDLRGGRGRLLPGKILHRRFQIYRSR